jgi:hypothetical protein
MRSASVSLAAAALLLTLVVLGTGIDATNTFASQNKNQENPTLSDPISSILPEKVQSIPQAKTTATRSSSATVDPRTPHYFLQERKPSSGTLASGSSNNVFYNGGPTVHTSISYTIFWLPSGSSFEQLSGTNSAYMSLIEQFLNDTSGTPYYNILSQYPDSLNGAPIDKAVVGGYYLDTTPYPSNGTETSPLHDSDIQAEVVRAMAANNWVAGPTKIFHVFTGYGIQSCYDSSNTECTFNAYCAYHSFFTPGSQPIIYSNMPDFNGLSGRCTPRGLPPPNGDYFADPEINVLSHELFEAVSDPLLDAWHDSSGEIADKCAWTFGTVNANGSNIVLNGHKYLVQLEWSNYGSTCVLTYGPSHEVSIAPSPGSNTFPATTTFNITYTSQGSSWWTTTSYTNGTLSLKIDQNTDVVITNKTPSSNQNEEWCFDQKCLDVSINSGNGTATRYFYYDLLAQPVQVSSGGGVPFASLDFATGSTLPSTLGFPQELTIQLNQTTQTIWVQRGTIVSISSPTGIGVNTRWVTRVTSWVISQSSQIPYPIIYFPQYLTTFEYTVSSGGSYSTPSVTYYDTGMPKTVIVGIAVWADSASAYNYQNQLPGSTSYERWSTTTPTGLVSSPASISTTYYHQYNVTISFQLTSGSPSATPSIIGETYGLNVLISLTVQPTTIWLDTNSIYSLTNTLSGPSAQERWQIAAAASGLISSAAILSPTYTHQYFLTVSGVLPGGAGQGWYNSGSTALATSPGVYDTSSTSRIRLTAYVSDGGFPNLLNTPFQQVGIRFMMDRPHIIEFISGPQYSLTSVLQTESIESITVSPTDDSWYDNGTSVYIVLNRSWGTLGNTRQSLVSYSIDNVVTSIDRTSTGPVNIPAITMTTSHVLGPESAIQFFVSIQGATLSGSQTRDGWFDSGSQFVIQGAYDRAYPVDNSYDAYAVPVGFQILANTAVSSVLWSGSSMTLSFRADQTVVTVYIPKELNFIPTEVSDDGMPIVFFYSPSSALMSFRGSSAFQVIFSRTSGTSVGSIIPNWAFYPVTITIVAAVILLLGLLLIKKRARKQSHSLGSNKLLHWAVHFRTAKVFFF